MLYKIIPFYFQICLEQAILGLITLTLYPVNEL